MDTMILVVDSTKGLQTQTAEGLVIGELTASNMIVVLNKIDTIPESKRDATLKTLKTRISRALKDSKFVGSPFVEVAANPVAASGSEANRSDPQNIESLRDTIISSLRFSAPDKHVPGDFLFAVDHCFPIKGQGTVVTGTVLRGSVSLNQQIEFPVLRIDRRVKSMQMFRKPVQCAAKGDRVGICVTQFDPTNMERGFACAPGTVQSFGAAIVAPEKIRFYKREIASDTKFHITVGHTTVMAKVMFFAESVSSADGEKQSGHFQSDAEYVYETRLFSDDEKDAEVAKLRKSIVGTKQWCLLLFDHHITCPERSIFIASRLDTDTYTKQCRLAFAGSIVRTLTDGQFVPAGALANTLRVIKEKERVGSVDRVVDDCTVIGKGMFSKFTDIRALEGLEVGLEVAPSRADGGDDGWQRIGTGVIDGPFGKTGKFRVKFRGGGATTGRLVMTQKKNVFVKKKQKRKNG
eukprot:TRINITY_DN1375_c0_g1_i3.p1 TRINITY_DN1375_c0_g1~~TRINITY_DN1375_c0_g1_i3.p1  ORF type:complete len:464 (+),score=100.51 TRINITY_DN1375_c0_g1_i3:696-2087(+)